MTKHSLWIIIGVCVATVWVSPSAFAQTDPAPTTPSIPVTITPPNDINPEGLRILNQPGVEYVYPSRRYTLEDPQLSDIPLLIEYAIRFLLGIVGAVMIFFFAGGAFEYIWMISIEKKQEGKTRMEYAAIGFTIVLLSYTIVDVVVRAIF